MARGRGFPCPQCHLRYENRSVTNVARTFTKGGKQYFVPVSSIWALMYGSRLAQSDRDEAFTTHEQKCSEIIKK